MDIDKTLSNPKANAKTQRIWSLLVENYGKKVISGHCINNGLEDYNKEMAYFKDTVGIMPAMMVFEMYDYDYVSIANDIPTGAVERAISWAKDEGGIVGFHWHWRMGSEYFASGKQWWQSFYSENLISSFKSEFTDAMNTKSGKLYDYIIRDIDLISEQLKKLKENNVTVLWRPLHEASGEWFWWGGSGAETCVKLWKLIYERMTDYHCLDNLIWIWNSEVKDGWFPGREYVDIVSWDVGAEAFDHKSYSDIFNKLSIELAELGTMKMFALTETGPIPDIGKMEQEKAMWSFWATWVGIPTSTTVDMMKSTLNDSRVITLSDFCKGHQLTESEGEKRYGF